MAFAASSRSGGVAPATRIFHPSELPVALGVISVELPEEMRQELLGDLPSGQGLVVTHVSRFSPAEKAGVRPADIVLTAGGAPVASRLELMLALKGRMAGEEFPLTVLRDGRVKSIPVVLEPRERCMKAEPRPVASLSGDVVGQLMALQREIAESLAQDLLDAREVILLMDRIRVLSGGGSGEGGVRMTYRDEIGCIVVECSPELLVVKWERSQGTEVSCRLDGVKGKNPLPAFVRERLREMDL